MTVEQESAASGEAAAPAGRRTSVPRWIVLVGLLVAIGLGGYRLWIVERASAGGPRVALSVDDSWHAQLGLSTSTYLTALSRVDLAFEEVRPGGDPVEAILERSDALLLAGGGDVDPARYGGDAGEAPVRAVAVDAERDAFELALIAGALAREMPILGICRGLQILNVAHGGTLRAIRDDPEIGPAHGGRVEWHHHHPVALEPGSLFAKLEGSPTKRANSYHGQAIDRLGEGLTAVARAPDGVIEAVAREDRNFVLATQWHPEMLSLEHEADLQLFERLKKAARRYARRHPKRPTKPTTDERTP